MAKRRLNKNLVVSLSLLTFAGMIALSVLMLLKLRQRDPQYFVNLAQEYERDGQWQAAELFYRQAWERSNDATYLVSRGEMLLNEGEIGRAIVSWRTALINQPNLSEAHMRRLEVLLELARLYRRIENWEQVQEAAETFLKIDAPITPEDSAFADNARGMALTNLARQSEGNAEQGEEALKSAVDQAPEVAAYSLDLAGLYILQDRVDDAERIYVELLERHTAHGADAAGVRLAYARYQASHRRFPEARRLFNECLTLAEGEPKALREARLGYAVFLSQQWARALKDDPASPSTQALFDQAETILRKGMEADPDQFDPYLQTALLYKSADRHADVVDACESRLKRGFSRKGVEGRRNQFNTFLLMIYASEACVAASDTARQGGDQDQREKWLQEAQQYVADARGEHASHPYVLSQSGRVKLARGLDREALDALRAANEAYKSYDTINWNDKILLARLHLKLNEAGAARAVLEEVINEARRKRGNDIRFWMLYAQVLFQDNEVDRALAISNQILAADPKYADALRLKAAVYERKGRREEAGRIFESLTGDRVVRAILTAQQLALDGDAEQAVTVLREALEENPADLRLVRAAHRELQGLGRIEEAGAIVDTALAVNPQDTKLRKFSLLMRADLPSDERDRAMLEIIEAQEDEYQRALELIGFYWGKDDLDKTLQVIDQALEHLIAKDTPAAQNATNAQHRSLLAVKLSVAASLDDVEASDAARAAAERFNVDGSGGKSLLGLYHMHRKEYGLAINALRQAIEVQSTDVRSLMHLGQCLQIVGRTEEAQVWYERAIRINPNDGSAHKAMAALAKQRGETDTYESHLAICERLIPNDRWVRAEVLARNEHEDPRAAIARREKLLEEEPEDVDNLARLATLCETITDIGKADDYYTRLLKLRPDDKEVMVAVGKYFRRTGRPQRSLELTTRYADSRPTPEGKANAHILIAAHYMSRSELDLVESTLLSALEMAETFEVTQSLAEFYLHHVNLPGQALPWFDKAVSYARAAKLPQLPRVLAARISCLLHRKLNDVGAAQRHVEDLRATFPDYPQGRLLQSEVYARIGRIDEAISALSDYLVQKPDDPYALYQRALHHYVRGRIPSAVEDLQTIKRIDRLALDLKPRFLLAGLYRQTARKDLWIRELESLVEDAPDSSPALERLVDAHIREGRLADAELIVTARINRDSAPADARWFFLRGRISFELGHRSKAVTDFQRGAQISGHTAESVTNVLDLYLRLDRFDQGIRYYKSYAPSAGATPALISRYARLLAKFDRKPEAVDLFRHAMRLAITDSPIARAAVTADLYAAFPVTGPSSPPFDETIALFEGGAIDSGMARVNERILVRLYRAAALHDDAAARLEALIGSCTDKGERVDLLFELGELHQITGNGTRARQAYEQALTYDSDNWIVLNNLAYLLSDDFGEYELARSHAVRAVAIADNPTTLDTLGWIYVGLRDHALGIAELSRALRLSPGQALTYYHLGEAYRRIGQFHEATNILTNGLNFARAAHNPEQVTRLEASLERAARSDATP